MPTLIATPEEVTGVILSAGGIPVWAHPPAEHFRRLLPRLLDAGLRGLEAYRATRVYVRLAEVEEVARKQGLVLTGGSDWHGPERRCEAGRFLGDSGGGGRFPVGGGDVAGQGNPDRSLVPEPTGPGNMVGGRPSSSADGTCGHHGLNRAKNVNWTLHNVMCS